MMITRSYTLDRGPNEMAVGTFEASWTLMRARYISPGWGIRKFTSHCLLTSPSWGWIFDREAVLIRLARRDPMSSLVLSVVLGDELWESWWRSLYADTQ